MSRATLRGRPSQAARLGIGARLPETRPIHSAFLPVRYLTRAKPSAVRTLRGGPRRRHARRVLQTHPYSGGGGCTESSGARGTAHTALVQTIGMRFLLPRIVQSVSTRLRPGFELERARLFLAFLGVGDC